MAQESSQHLRPVTPFGIAPNPSRRFEPRRIKEERHHLRGRLLPDLQERLFSPTLSEMESGPGASCEAEKASPDLPRARMKRDRWPRPRHSTHSQWILQSS